MNNNNNNNNTKRGLIIGAAACVFTLAGAAHGGALTESASAAAFADDHKHDAKALEILDGYLEKLGGVEVIDAIESTRLTGTMEIPMAGLTGNMVMMSKRPGMVSMTITIPGFGETRSGYDGNVGWSSDPMSGPRLMTEDEVESLKEQADPRIAMQYRDLYKTIEYAGQTGFEGSEAHKIRLVDADGDEQIEYFDPGSGLMVGQVSTQATPMGEIEVTTVMSDYKEFGGMSMPTKIVTKLGPQEIIMNITTAEINNVEADVFELPAEIKALVDAKEDG
ncbi:MAG: hypothetical protein AAGA55_01355 [Planctomycetota bacterium]